MTVDSSVDGSLDSAAKGSDTALRAIPALAIHEPHLRVTQSDYLLTGGGDQHWKTRVGSSTEPYLETHVLPHPRVSARRGGGPVRRNVTALWVRPYLAGLLALDFAAATLAALTAFLVRFPVGPAGPSWRMHYVPATLALPVVWLLILWIADAYQPRVLGLGAEEFQRVIRALMILLALVGVGSYAARLEVARGYVIIALPLAAGLTLIGRYLARKRLHRRRLRGQAGTSVIAAGDAGSVLELAEHLHSQPYLGLQVAGACILRSQLADQEAIARLSAARIPVLGDLDQIAHALRSTGADAVAVTSSAVTPRRLRELSWTLERSHAELMVAPGLVEIAGPRLHIRPITGLPMLHIEKPEFAGVRRIVKSAFDRTAAALGLLLISPLLIGVFMAVRLGSSGPAFFRQTRVGKDGKEFRIWKFRSMYVDAEARLAEFQALNDNVGGGMFKMKADPRVTTIGRFIRRYSIDELPQLINVLNGTMSLVGPRPPLPAEVAKYGYDARRRLLVRPGLTGLWQVSGRSDLSWEETVRLDLRYVENWSLSQDALILWKTASAVLRGAGAY